MLRIKKKLQATSPEKRRTKKKKSSPLSTLRRRCLFYHTRMRSRRYTRRRAAISKFSLFFPISCFPFSLFFLLPRSLSTITPQSTVPLGCGRSVYRSADGLVRAGSFGIADRGLDNSIGRLMDLFVVWFICAFCIYN